MDLVPHLDPAHRVEAGGGLVEEQHLGVVHEGRGEVEPPLHAAGVGADHLAERVADVDEVGQLVEALLDLGLVEAVEAALQPEQLDAGLLRVEGGVLEGDADAQAHLVGLACRRRSRPPWPTRRSGLISVQSTRTVVDFPAPFGPRKP